MVSSYPATNAAYTMPTKQQPQPQLSIPQQCWLLQQPHDSGYADGDEDLFAQAFKPYEPDFKTIQWMMGVQNAPMVSDSPSTTSPFEYADSLILPSKQWQSYDTNFSTTYCLDGSMAYNMPHYQSTESLSQAAVQACQQSPNDLSLVPLARQNMMEDYVETEPTARPRQREHHTAVEQRYRKNLNEQFTNLRLAIPDIQTCQPQRAGQPAKPSKCEVLAGAVDYIRQLEEENQRLKAAGNDEADASRKRARTME